MFTAIIGPVASLAKTWIEGKQKKAQLKSQVELTKLEATKTKIEKDGFKITLQKIKSLLW